MKHKSQSISNKSTSGPLDLELNEESLHIFLVLFEEGDKGGTFSTWMAIASSIFITRGFVNFRNSTVHPVIVVFYIVKTLNTQKRGLLW